MLGCPCAPARVVCVKSTESLYTQYLANHLWKFQHIYSFGAVGHKDFEVKRTKVTVTAGPHYGQVSTLGGISHLSLECVDVF